MDPLTFWVSGRKKLALSVKTVTFRPFSRRDMSISNFCSFIEEQCCPLAIIFNIPVVFLCMKISMVAFWE